MDLDGPANLRRGRRVLQLQPSGRGAAPGPAGGFPADQAPRTRCRRRTAEPLDPAGRADPCRRAPAPSRRSPSWPTSTAPQDEIRLLQAGLVGSVAIGFVGTATYDLLPRVARSVREHLPGVALELFGERLSPTLIDDLHARRLDIAVLRDPAPDSELTIRPLRSERLVAALPADHPLAAGDTVSLAALSDSTFVTHPSGQRSAMYDTVMQACRSVGFLPAQIVEVRETATLVTFVAAGIGVALVPEPVRSLALEGVVFRPLTDVDQTTDLALATRAGELSATVARVVDVIEAVTSRGTREPPPESIGPLRCRGRVSSPTDYASARSGRLRRFRPHGRRREDARAESVVSPISHGQ